MRRFGAGDMALAALVPAIFTFTAWLIAHTSFIHSADPNYAYLLNCLKLFQLRASGMWPHPGTTVQMVGDVAIVLAWLATIGRHGFASLYDTVIRSPEFYLTAIDILMAILNAAALVFLFHRLRDAARSRLVALAGCATVLVSVPAFLSLRTVSPEPLLLFASVVLAAVLAPFAFSRDGGVDTRTYATAVGCILGFSLASKITAAPLLLFVFWAPGSASRKRTLLAAVLSALVLTLPIATHYVDVGRWIYALFTHKQAYGSGQAGAPSLAVLAGNGAKLLSASPETFLFPCLYAVALAARRFGLEMPGNAARMLRLCILVVAVSLLLILKQPTTRYLISTVGLLCLGNAILARYVLAAPKVRAWGRALLAVILLAAGAAFETSSALAGAPRRESDHQFMARVQASRCLLVYYYGVDAVPVNMFFGYSWSGAFADKLAQAYPKFVTLRLLGSSVFTGFQGDLSPVAVQALAAPSHCVDLVGPPLERFDQYSVGIDRKYLAPIARTPGGVGDALVWQRLDPAFFTEKR